DAIQEGDRLSVVFFANSNSKRDSADCNTDLPIPSTMIDSSSSRADIKNSIGRLCKPNGATTDLGEAVTKTLKELNLPGGNSLKIVFFFTDFIHEPPEDSLYAQRY